MIRFASERWQTLFACQVKVSDDATMHCFRG